MLHQLTIGHLDIESLERGCVHVLRPLDMDVVTRLLQEIGEIDSDGRARLGGHLVEVKSGYIVCPWLMPLRNRRTEEFARRLWQETGCVMADVKRREVIRPEQLD